MKRSQLILFGFFLVVTGLIYVSLTMNRKEYSKKMKEEGKVLFVPIREVHNKTRLMPVTSYGQISPNIELIVSFEVQGKLLRGQKDKELKPGTRFRKGEILYKIDNEEAFYSFEARKSSFANLMLATLPDIEMDFPEERNKWVKFINNLSMIKELPELPKFSTTKERMFMTNKGVISEYYNLVSTESRLRKYMYSAPFDGTVVEVFSEPGSIVNPGSQVAKIAKVGDYEVRVPIDLKELEKFKGQNNATFIDAGGTSVGTGKIMRISDVVNQQTQSADVYYSISPIKGQKIYHGMFVSVSIERSEEQASMSLPRNAVKDNRVHVLVDRKLVPREIRVIGNVPDTLFVTGLKDGEKVVLEQVEDSRSGLQYEGVSR